MKEKEIKMGYYSTDPAVEKFLVSAPDFEIIKKDKDIDGKEILKFKAYGAQWAKRHHWVDKGMGEGFHTIELDFPRIFSPSVKKLKKEKLKENLFRISWSYQDFKIIIIEDLSQ